MVAAMDVRFERRESEDPWRGKQPKYEKLVYAGRERFLAITKLPSGKRIAVQLGRLTLRRGRLDP